MYITYLGTRYVLYTHRPFQIKYVKTIINIDNRFLINTITLKENNCSLQKSVSTSEIFSILPVVVKYVNEYLIDAFLQQST